MKGKNICAIALGAGESKRMEENKLLLKYKQLPLFSYVLNLIHECFTNKVLVTCYDEIKRYGAICDFDCVHNENSSRGIGASIVLGVSAAKNADGYMFFPLDQPNLTKETVQTLIDTFEKQDSIVVPCSNGVRYSPCIFPARYKKELLAITGDTGGKQVYMRHLSDTIFVEFESKNIFFDVDTKSDYYGILGENLK